MSLIIVAKIKARAGAEDKLHQELLKLLKPTRAEEGCMEYILHRSIEDPSLFLFYEIWANKSLWDKHMQSQHLLDFSNFTKNWTEVFELYQLAKENEES